MKLAKRLDRFPEYIFARLARQVAAVEKRTGRKVFNLGQGSPDLPPSPVYLDKLAEYIREPDAHRYPGYGPIPAFYHALRHWYRERFRVELEDDNIFVLAGAKEAILTIGLAVLDPGDEVLVPNPGYQGYPGPPRVMGAVPVYYDLSEEFRPDIEALRQVVTPRSKLIWVNFPSNPTGTVASLEELSDLVAFAREHDLIIAYDNAYAHIVFDRDYRASSILEIDGAEELAVEVGSFSKTFSFAGYRLGYLAGNPDLVKAVAKVHSQKDSGVPKPLQQMAAYAMMHFDEAWHEKLIDTYRSRRDTVLEHLAEMGLTANKPAAGLYVWARIPDEFDDSQAYALELLEEKQIFVTPGTAFGGRGERYVRISLCADMGQITSYLRKTLETS